jgi:molybdopterin converting factor small subunit
VASIADLIECWIDRRIPGFRDQLDDSVFNFAVNDEMLLFHARERALQDGDVVEVIPTISGGDLDRPSGKRDRDDGAHGRNATSALAGEIPFNMGCTSFLSLRRPTRRKV